MVTPSKKFESHLGLLLPYMEHQPEHQTCENPKINLSFCPARHQPPLTKMVLSTLMTRSWCTRIMVWARGGAGTSPWITYLLKSKHHPPQDAGIYFV